jgi:hypothetical protein
MARSKDSRMPPEEMHAIEMEECDVFDVGDVVELRSGGPPMVVASVPGARQQGAAEILDAQRPDARPTRHAPSSVYGVRWFTAAGELQQSMLEARVLRLSTRRNPK